MNGILNGIAVDTEYWQDGQKITPYTITGCSELSIMYWTNLGKCYNTFEDLKQILEDPKVPKYFHNAKADLKTLWALGINVQNVAFDTLLAAYILNPLKKGKYGLKTLVSELYGHEMIDFHSRFKKGETYKDIYNEDPEIAKTYALEDAMYTYKLVKKFKPFIDSKFKEVYYDIELPLVAILAQMEQHGVMVDRERLRALKDEYQVEANNLEDRLKAIGNPIVGAV